MIRKKIGEFKYGTHSTPLWANVFKGTEDQTLFSVYFTRNLSPRNEEWYRDLKESPLNVRYIRKGSWQYGVYYKVIITHRIDKFKKLFDILKTWKYDLNIENVNNTTYTFDIKHDIDYVVNEKIIDKL